MTNFLFYFRTVQSSRGSQRVGDLTLLQIYHLFIFLTTVRLARSLMFVFKLDFSSFFLSISHLSIRYTIIVSPEPEEMDRIHSCVWKKFFVSFSFMLFSPSRFYSVFFFLVTFSTEMKSKLLIHYSLCCCCCVWRKKVQLKLLFCDLINGFFLSFSGTILLFFITRKSYITVFLIRNENKFVSFSSPIRGSPL